MWTNSVIEKSANQEEKEAKVTEQKNINYFRNKVSNSSSSNVPSISSNKNISSNSNSSNNPSNSSNCLGNAKRLRRSGGGGGGVRHAAAPAGAASAQGAAVVPAMEEAEQE